jgi:pilus assembly protein Flp/PilA
MSRVLVRFLTDDSGATAIEYGLIAALIAIALIGAFAALGGVNGSVWGAMQNKAVPVFDNAAN